MCLELLLVSINDEAQGLKVTTEIFIKSDLAKQEWHIKIKDLRRVQDLPWAKQRSCFNDRENCKEWASHPQPVLPLRSVKEEPTGLSAAFEIISASGKANLKGTNYTGNRVVFPFKFSRLSQVSSPFSGLSEVLLNTINLVGQNCFLLCNSPHHLTQSSLDHMQDL